MRPYALGTFSTEGGPPFAGLVIDDRVAPVHTLTEQAGESGDPRTTLEMLASWETSRAMLERLAQSARTEEPVWRALSDLVIRPPVDLPRQVFCTGANYRKHVVELTIDMGVGPEGLSGDALRRWAEDMMDERAASGEPYVFTKPVSAVAGANDPLPIPGTTQKADWELELGVVIGKGGYRISRQDALSHVAGYAIVNDVTARDLIARTDYKQLGTDWLRAKGQPGFLPFGPYLTPSQFVDEPQRLRMRLSVSGRTMQDETTADMIFDVARQIEYISTYARLLPGDLICTGSPAGNGTHYNRFLQPGDVMIAEIEGLGAQHTKCVAG